MTGRLTLVGTPIGNLGDLSPRAAEALREAGLVACEDTRRTAVLLRHAGSSAPMLPVHEHNEAARAADLAGRMAAGLCAALVSDAGMPAVSDPGRRVVQAAIEAGIPMQVVPGPSAIEAALVLSGMPTEPFAFVGFFPRRAAERRGLFERVDPLEATVVGFESPRRVGGLVAELAERDPERPVAVCRELTKMHEEVLRGSARELTERLTGPIRGEVTVVIGPSGTPRAVVGTALANAVALLRAEGISAARTADLLAGLGVAPRNEAYRAALAHGREEAGL